MDNHAELKEKRTVQDDFNEATRTLQSLVKYLLDQPPNKMAAFVSDTTSQLQAWSLDISDTTGALNDIHKVEAMADKAQILLRGLTENCRAVESSGNVALDNAQFRIKCEDSINSLFSLSEQYKAFNVLSATNKTENLDSMYSRLRDLSFYRNAASKRWILLTQPIPAEREYDLLSAIVADPFNPLDECVIIPHSNNKKNWSMYLNGNREFTFNSSTTVSSNNSVRSALSLLGTKLFTKAKVRAPKFHIQPSKVQTKTIDDTADALPPLTDDQIKSVNDIISRSAKKKAYLVTGVLKVPKAEIKSSNLTTTSTLSRGVPNAVALGARGRNEIRHQNNTDEVIFAARYRSIRMKKVPFPGRLSVGKHVDKDMLRA